jgi:aminopeptidase N
VNRLLAGKPEREKFQRYARSILHLSFDALGWEPKSSEPVKSSSLRASLIAALGDLNDPEIVAGCRERFETYAKDPDSLPPDLRPPILAVVGRYADEATWNQLHGLGLKTTSTEEKQNYYYALAAATDPKLVKTTLPIALTDELPTSRAVFLVIKVARESEHPELAWEFAKANMKALLAKADALGASSYAPSLFTFFSDPARVAELRSYAKANLPAASAKDVAKAVDEIEFRAELKTRLAGQLNTWLDKKALK